MVSRVRRGTSPSLSRKKEIQFQERPVFVVGLWTSKCEYNGDVGGLRIDAD